MPKTYIVNEHDIVCAQCAPPHVEPDLSAGETDSPQNCDWCGRPCEYSLTSYGVAYVLEHAQEVLGGWHTVDWLEPRDEPGRYYHGSPKHAVVTDWVRDLAWYGLPAAAKAVIDAYLELIEGDDLPGGRRDHDDT